MVGTAYGTCMHIYPPYIHAKQFRYGVYMCNSTGILVSDTYLVIRCEANVAIVNGLVYMCSNVGFIYRVE